MGKRERDPDHDPGDTIGEQNRLTPPEGASGRDAHSGGTDAEMPRLWASPDHDLRSDSRFVEAEIRQAAAVEQERRLTRQQDRMALYPEIGAGYNTSLFYG